MNLNVEQVEVLIIMGQPDDAGKLQFLANGERIVKELGRRGLAREKGTRSYALTHRGQELLDQLLCGR